MALALLAACGKDRAPTDPPAEADPPDRAPPSPAVEVDARGCAEGVAPLPRRLAAGVSVAHNYQHRGQRGYGTATSRRTLDELRELGVRGVSLTPFGYMRALGDSEVHLMRERPEAENDAHLEREIRAAHARGLRVLLKPHIWIAGGAWRGDLAPRDWDAWFASYRRFTLHYARMAARLGVARFAVGVEFPTEGPLEARWRALIAAVREVYDGELTFAANWDRVEAVPFWDAVDAIGVQFYPPLADVVGAPEAAMRRALDARLDALGGLASREGRPVWLTEVGYKSIEGAEVHPHEWPERHGSPTVSQAAQARAYARLFDALAGRDFVRAFYLWKWFTDPETDEEGPDGFSPRGKRAQAVLRAALSGACRDRGAR